MKTPKPTFTNGFGSFRYGISFLWDDLNAENIRNGDELPVCHLNHAAARVCVNPPYANLLRNIRAALLSLIRHKVGDGRSGPAGKQLLETLQFRVHSRHFVFVQFYTTVRQPPGFRNGGAVTSQSGKG